MNHIFPDYRHQRAYRSFGEDQVFIRKSDSLIKASTLLLILAMGCCVYFYGVNHRADKNYQNNLMVKPLIDGFLHNQGTE